MGKTAPRILSIGCFFLLSVLPDVAPPRVRLTFASVGFKSLLVIAVDASTDENINAKRMNEIVENDNFILKDDVMVVV